MYRCSVCRDLLPKLRASSFPIINSYQLRLPLLTVMFFTLALHFISLLFHSLSFSVPTILHHRYTFPIATFVYSLHSHYEACPSCVPTNLVYGRPSETKANSTNCQGCAGEGQINPCNKGCKARRTDYPPASQPLKKQQDRSATCSLTVQCSPDCQRRASQR
jgi:hypothetical protein